MFDQTAYNADVRKKMLERDRATPAKIPDENCAGCLCLTCANWLVLLRCGKYRCVKCLWRGPVNEGNCPHGYKPA